MFKKNFIACVKKDGKILKEITDEGLTKVIIPFGSDYSILLKNKNSRKAVVNIDIDGKDVLNGNSIIVDSNRETELMGELDDCLVKNRFRFIEKTEKISDYRGDRIDDGFVRIEFKFEKEKSPPCYYHQYPVYYRSYKTYYENSGTSDLGNILLSSCVYNPVNDGITVKGAEVNQGFTVGSTDDLEENSHVIIFKLVGKTDKKVIKPVTVKSKVVCDVCGAKNKINNKYCYNCGNYVYVLERHTFE